MARSWATLNILRLDGLQKFFLKLFLLPAFFVLLWVFYVDAFKAPEETFQRTFVTRNGLIFTSLAGAYCMAVVSTAATFVSVRTRYYQEAREGLYSGPTFLLSQMVANLPLSAMTTALAAFITFRGLKDELVCLFVIFVCCPGQRLTYCKWKFYNYLPNVVDARRTGLLQFFVM